MLVGACVDGNANVPQVAWIKQLLVSVLSFSLYLGFSFLITYIWVIVVRGLVLHYTTVAIDSFTQSRSAYLVSNNCAICPQCLQVLYSCTAYSFRIMKWYLLPQTGCLLQPIKLQDKRQWYWDSPAITVTIAFDRICLLIDICRRKKNMHTNSGEHREAGCRQSMCMRSQGYQIYLV